ncbi:competence protein CoiA [Defluviimonas sp. D31]|uniref:competence protein CoiA n=1 Tax=Defluviimonas sp. D31 TaxID=3083253 RepID=UPI003990775F
MKFANIEGVRVEPFPNAHGTCPHCGEAVIAKCGNLRVWHWAHKSKQHCDRWWEPETEWHRRWKNQFPVEWQEQGRRAESGELHVADVLTPHGLVLEFQHSAIKREQVQTRINFHKNICWIVNGRRLESSLAQFERALE